MLNFSTGKERTRKKSIRRKSAFWHMLGKRASYWAKIACIALCTVKTGPLKEEIGIIKVIAIRCSADGWSVIRAKRKLDGCKLPEGNCPDIHTKFWYLGNINSKSAATKQ